MRLYVNFDQWYWARERRKCTRNVHLLANGISGALHGLYEGARAPPLVAFYRVQHRAQKHTVSNLGAARQAGHVFCECAPGESLGGRL
jgi:hypothetical protein